MSNSSLKRAVAIVGSQLALANAIGTTQQQVSYWLRQAKKAAPPAEYVIKIETATRGIVTRHDLRPDLYPVETAA